MIVSLVKDTTQNCMCPLCPERSENRSIYCRYCIGHGCTFGKASDVAHPIPPGLDVTGRCVKCRYASGDSWSQCEGICPIPGSPHYSADSVERIERIAELEKEIDRIQDEIKMIRKGRKK